MAVLPDVSPDAALDLVVAMERVVTLVRGLTPTGDMSLTAAATLRLLDRSGPHRISELAATQSVTQPAMTQLVTRLERDGLAARGGSGADARVVLVDITPAGRDLLRARREHRAQRLAELLETLPPADRRAVLDSVPALNLLAGLASPATGQPDDGSSTR